jgi:osmoprotectant transport system ATP-binding protein
MVADFVGSDRALKRLRVTEIDPDLLEHPPVLPPDATLTEAREAMARADALLVVVVDENDVLCGVVRATRADGDGPVSSRVEPAEGTVPLNGKLQDVLARVLLTDLGWVAVVDGARYVGGLTPESVFESLRRSMDISDAEEFGAAPGL